MFRAININQDVYVILTREGEKVLEERHNRIREGNLESFGKDIGDFNISDYLNDKYFICPLWKLLEIFGPDINTNYIKDNLIIYKEEE